MCKYPDISNAEVAVVKDFHANSQLNPKVNELNIIIF